MSFLDHIKREKPKARRKRMKRNGAVTKVEKDLIARVIADQSAEMTTSQVNALAIVTRRSRATIKKAVEEAHETFVDRSQRYVDIHLQTVEAGLSSGTDKGLEVAQRGSQWAIENISEGGARIVEKASKDESSGTRIMIGVALGGVKAPLTQGVIDITKVGE